MTLATFVLIVLAVAAGHVIGMAVVVRFAHLAGRRFVAGIVRQLTPVLAVLGVRHRG